MTGLNLPSDDEQSDKMPFAEADERYAVVRKPDANGAVLAKFDRPNRRYPKSLCEIDSLIVTYFETASELNSQQVDRQAELTDKETKVLEKAGWDVI